MKSSRATFLHWLVSHVGTFYLRVVGWTSIVQYLDHPSYLTLRRERRPFVYAFWHNSQVYLAYDHRGEGAGIMVSQSKDGEYIAQVMKRLGLEAVRGSSSRGGQKAFREIVARLQEGGQAGFTPDGPKGPVYSVSAGVVAAAQMSGVPIVAVGLGMTHQLTLGSWDKFRVPLPAGRILVGHGKPFKISEGEVCLRPK